MTMPQAAADAGRGHPGARRRRARVEATERREALWQAQTPQMFRYGSSSRRSATAARSGHRRGRRHRAPGTKPRPAMGELRNLKATYPEDLVARRSHLLEADRSVFIRRRRRLAEAADENRTGLRRARARPRPQAPHRWCRARSLGVSPAIPTPTCFCTPSAMRSSARPVSATSDGSSQHHPALQRYRQPRSLLR